mgnify:CR=1 FL=1
MAWVETNPSSEWFSGAPAGGLGQASTLPSDGTIHPERPIGFIWPEVKTDDEEEDGY